MLRKLQSGLARIYLQYIPNIAVLFLFPVSCWSTFSGIRELMRSTAGVGEIEGLLISIALTAGIQITLLLAVCSLMRAPYRMRPLYLAIYSMTVFFSVLFGYAFYFRHLRADDLAREVHQQESQRMLLDAGRYQAGLEAVSANFQQLAAYSAEQSKVEDSLGGTCGDDSPTGRGPRTRGRRKDADLFGGLQQRLTVTTSRLGEEVRQLHSDLETFDVARIDGHHRVLERFYQGLSASRQQTARLLEDARAYVDVRFPQGRYTIEEGGVSYPCPDSQLEYLATLVAQATTPELPPPPATFESNNPKVVVHHALEELAGWLSGAVVSSPPADGSAGAGSLEAFRQAWQRNLPLFLGLLVDCLIFLAAFSSRGRKGVEVSSLERLGRLDELPASVQEGLRRQLAALLGCSPASSLYAAYRLLQRYEIRRSLSIRPWVRVMPASSYVAVPRGGSRTESWPELIGLHDLIRLLESLGLAACQSTGARWSELPAPLPVGLAELSETGRQVEVVELYRLDSRLMGDLVQEAFVSDELEPRIAEEDDQRPLSDRGGPEPASI